MLIFSKGVFKLNNFSDFQPQCTQPSNEIYSPKLYHYYLAIETTSRTKTTEERKQQNNLSPGFFKIYIIKLIIVQKFFLGGTSTSQSAPSSPPPVAPACTHLREINAFDKINSTSPNLTSRASFAEVQFQIEQMYLATIWYFHSVWYRNDLVHPRSKSVIV